MGELDFIGAVMENDGVESLGQRFKVRSDYPLRNTPDKCLYKNWLPNRSDSLELSERSKRQAFQKAQRELKAKYPNPYFWGAFVMVGE